MTDDASLTLEALAERYYADGDGTRKGGSYLQSYARLLNGRRQEPLRILELGVSSGASLLSWRDYLPNATIVGIDIAPAPQRLLGVDRIHVLQGSQDDPAVLDQAAVIAGGSFDLIVDDASHIGYLTKRSFLYLFTRWLVPGGCYVIEDFGTGYLSDYPDGADYVLPRWNDATPETRQYRSSQYGMAGVIKQLVDYLMQELMTGTRSWLPIERITIETNIVFVDKSMQPGGPAPALLPDVAPPPENSADGRLNALAAAVERHADRIAKLENAAARLRRLLAPLAWLNRRDGRI